MNTENDERLIQELMDRSLLKMPFSDFEDKVMDKIHQEERRSLSFKRSIILSWLFLIIGTSLGIFLTTLAYNSGNELFGFSFLNTLWIIPVVLSIVILSQFDKLLHFTFRKR